MYGAGNERDGGEERDGEGVEGCGAGMDGALVAAVGVLRSGRGDDGGGVGCGGMVMICGEGGGANYRDRDDSGGREKSKRL